MKHRQRVAGLLAASLFLLAMLAVFAIELSNNQSKSKSDVAARVHERSVLAAALIDSLFNASSASGTSTFARYATPTVSDATLNRSITRGDSYVALLSADGRILARSHGFNAQAQTDLAQSATLRLLRAGRPWALGNVLPYGSTGVINFGNAIPTPYGKRYLLTGFPSTTLQAFIRGELQQIPGVRGSHNYLLDGTDHVLASTDPARPAGSLFGGAQAGATLKHRAGTVNGTYISQAPLPQTTWRIVLSAPNAALFGSVVGWRRWVPWLILGAFGLVAIAALALTRRWLRSTDQVRETNEQLGDANEQLANANTQLARHTEELQRSNAELEQFASIASHDLQEPLRKVRTFTERVWESDGERLSERARSDLERANASAERMQRLIEDLLKFSRVGTQLRPFTRVDLARVADEVLEDLDETIRSSDAEIKIGRLPVIQADEPQMRQLLQNLISNAVKFRREGMAPEVSVEATVEDDVVTLVVKDNGIGFDSRYRDRIFRVFERLHARGAYTGTGIGLAVCRKIAERHGGTVVADSVLGEGSTFTVTLRTNSTAQNPGGTPGETSPIKIPNQEHPYVAA